MDTRGARLTRRAVLGAALGGLALAAMVPQMATANPLATGDLRAIAFDRGDLVGAADALWRGDGEAAARTPLPSNFGEITVLATHPDREGRIFAGTGSGLVMVSDDGGASWKDASKGLPGAPVTALAVAAHQPDTLYAALRGDGLWTSKGAGETWEFAMDRPFEHGAERDLLTLASVNAETGMGGIWIYAGTESGLTRLPDCFCRWQDVQPGNAMDALAAGGPAPETTPLPEGEPVRSLASAPQDGAAIYAALPSGTWKSIDAGVNWAKVNDLPARLVAVNPEDPEHAVAVTDGGILSSRDGGLTWTAPGA